MSSRKLDFYLGFLDVVDVRVDEELWLLFISFENCNFNLLLSQKDVIIQKSGFNMQILIAKLFTTPWFPQYQRLNARKASNKSEIEIKLKKYSISQHFKNQNSLNSWFKNPKRHYLECLKKYSNRNATDFLQRKINIYPKICQTAKKKIIRILIFHKFSSFLFSLFVRRIFAIFWVENAVFRFVLNQLTSCWNWDVWDNGGWL